MPQYYRRGYRKPKNQEQSPQGSDTPSSDAPGSETPKTPPNQANSAPRGNRRPGNRPGNRPQRGSPRPQTSSAQGDENAPVNKPSHPRTFSPNDNAPKDRPYHRPNRPAQKRPAPPGDGSPQEGQTPQQNRPPNHRPTPNANTGSPEGAAQQQNRKPQRRQAPKWDIPAKEIEAPSSYRPSRPNQRRPKQRVESPDQGKPRSNRDPSPRGNSYSRRGSSPNNRFYDRPAPTVPIRTNRGIKARSQRGQFSQHWWAMRWIEAMESIVDPARLQRGRSYARAGQVLSIDETRNGIQAKVQGSRPQPYDVTIKVTPLTDEQWEQVIDALSEQALFTAQLLAGEMPANIEDAFNASGVSLFPSQTGDLISDCSCPDWANPCKHVAATHYILGDRFDDDPFLLFRMRGRSQEQILEALRQRRSDTAQIETEAEEEVVAEPEQAAPLEDSMDHFWEPAESLASFPLTMKLATMDMPLLQRLGEPAFLSGQSLQALLKPVYDIITRSALLAAYRDEEPEDSSNGNGNQEQG